jgi:outer membrane beta-barrel protein
VCFIVSYFFVALVSAQSDSSSVKIIEPKKDVVKAKSAAIDDERFELGIFTGLIAVEEFSESSILGASFSYHLTPKVLLQLNHATADVGRATFEDNTGGSGFLTDSEREFTYTNLLAGYRVLRGRSFWGKNSKYNSDIYLMAGLGSVDFAQGSSNTSFVIGSSYRVVLTDALTMNFDIRGHSVEREFNILDGEEGNKERTFNTEFVIGLNLLF